MLNGTDILVSPGESPFDAIRRTDPTGREYWMGRDLMPHLGYEKWERFLDAIGRARAACTNAGQHEVRNFRVVFPGAGKNPGGQGGRPAMDVELSRFAAYLVSMNGDPRKPEVAAAQTYFATATRWAETAQRTGFDVPKDFASALELAARQQRALEAAEATAAAERELRETVAQEAAALGARARELEPKAEAYDAFLDQAGAFPLATAAQLLGLGRQTLINRLGAWKVLIIRPGHSDHLRPYAEHLHEGRFVVKSADVPIIHRDGTKEVITRGTTLVTPKGLDYLRGRQRREDAAALSRRTVRTVSLA